MKGDPRSRRKRKKGDTAKLAARLAPLEEVDEGRAAKQLGSSSRLQDPQANHRYGAIVVDNDNLKLPEDIMEGSSSGKVLGMEPVVVAILVVMLAFIGFIAWQVSLMPAQ